MLRKEQTIRLHYVARQDGEMVVGYLELKDCHHEPGEIFFEPLGGDEACHRSFHGKIMKQFV